MKSVRLSVIATLLLTVSCLSVKAITADDIIKKNIEARGGEANLKKIKTAKFTGTINAIGTDIPVVQTVENGKALRLDITFMGSSGYTIITNTEGWVYMPMQGQTKAMAMPPEQVKIGQQQLDIFGGAVAYQENGGKADYIGEDTVNGSKCYKVKITDKNSNVQTLYFDENNFSQVRTVSAIEMSGQKTDVVTDYSDYRKFPEGVYLPMTIVTSNGKITLTSVELNKPVDAALFKPAQ